MEIWYLDSRSLYSLPSVNDYDQKIKQLIATTPFWEKDGGGIRGRAIAPILGGSGGFNLMADFGPQQFNHQRSNVIQQQDDPLPKLKLPSMGGDSATSYPFKISFASETTITIQAGTINNLLASGAGGFFNTDGSMREFSVGSGLSYVILTANSDGKKFTSCSISTSSSPPQVQEPTLFSLPLTARFTIGLTHSGAIHQIIYDNIRVSGRQQYIADKVIAAEAGQLPYEIYYVWG